jgi:hypothetical protein
MLNAWLLAAYVGIRTRVADWRDDRGDVPGWVLITLMTAGLVSVLWLAAGNKLGALLGKALDSVTPSSGG